MEEDEGALRALLVLLECSEAGALVTKSASHIRFTKNSFYSHKPTFVLSCAFTAALCKMMEEIEINLPRFDQCIR